MAEEVTKPLSRPTKRQRAVAHATRNKGKYSMAGALAAVTAALQLFGALGPLLCHMPWVKDPLACEAQARRATQAAQTLDTMSLDAGAVLE